MVLSGASKVLADKELSSRSTKSKVITIHWGQTGGGGSSINDRARTLHAEESRLNSPAKESQVGNDVKDSSLGCWRMNAEMQNEALACWLKT